MSSLRERCSPSATLSIEDKNSSGIEINTRAILIPPVVVIKM